MSVRRALSLDALRGLAILMMVLSGIIPFGVLPDWMYHAQLPPPTHAFDATLAGLTWVDLVFPMFLFAMGAAIPMALSRRLNQGISRIRLHLEILERGVMLAFFAIFLQHVRPFTLNPSPEMATWLIALTGFAVLFGIYLAPPKNWSKPVIISIRAISWISAFILLYFVTFPDGSGFKLHRSDIIILVLANMAVFGAWAWLLTRNNILLRLGLMGLLLACILSASSGGWVKIVWETTPFPWLFKFYYLKYLFIIIPGTIIGEILMRWSDTIPVRDLSQNDISKTKQIGEQSWSVNTYRGISAMVILLIAIPVVGLHARLVGITVISCIILGSILMYLVRNAVTDSEQIIREIIHWGLFWLALGLCFEPFEGGIKKDVSTFSYYFVTTGISVLILVVFMIVIDFFEKVKWVPLLVENGQNPMIAYVGMMNLLYPLLGLTGLLELIGSYTTDPWAGVLRAVLYTILLAWIVSVFTRRKIFWKT